MHSPLEIARNYIEVGIHKTNLSAFKMVILGFFAGMFIGFAGIASTTASSTIAVASVAKLAGAVVFPAGMAMVIACGIWTYTGLFGGQLAEAIVNAGKVRTDLSVMEAFVRGILCNILVCIAVWMSFAAKSVSGKLITSFWPIMLFVLCGFEHSIADMYFGVAALFTSAEYGIAAEGLTWFNFLVKSLVPISLGNIVGGAGIVGVGYWMIYLHRTPYLDVSVEYEQEEIDIAEEY